MAVVRSRESVIRNLEDAGCDAEMIVVFMNWFDMGWREKQLALLEDQREHLLERVHQDEKRIYCVDYLIRQIEGTVRETGGAYSSGRHLRKRKYDDGL